MYFGYDTLREQVSGTTADALRHAKQIVDAERFFGIYQEHRVQQAFLDWHPFISFWNIYYGTIHFVMPVIALVAMYRKMPARYVRWRNTLLFMLGFGLIGFWLYPLTPPRLMPAHYGFVDTAAEYFNFGPQQRIALDAAGQPTAAAKAAFGNLYAAMPSLHVGWATWSALALLPLAAPLVAQGAALLLPARSRSSRSSSPGTTGSSTRSAAGSSSPWGIGGGALRAVAQSSFEQRDRSGSVADRQVHRRRERDVEGLGCPRRSRPA